MSSHEYTLESLLRDLPAHALGEALAFHRKEVERLTARRKRAGISALYDRHESDALRAYHLTLCEAILQSGIQRDYQASQYEQRLKDEDGRS